MPNSTTTNTTLYPAADKPAINSALDKVLAEFKSIRGDLKTIRAEMKIVHSEIKCVDKYFSGNRKLLFVILGVLLIEGIGVFQILLSN